MQSIRTTSPALAALALFFFVFLGSEYLFDSMMGNLAGPDSVVIAQSLILGFSVIGFLIYSPYSKHVTRGRRPLAALAAFAVIACLALIAFSNSTVLVQVVGCFAFIVLGMTGSAAHWELARTAPSTYLARYVGFAYAGGLLIQFGANNLTFGALGEFILLALAAAALFVLVDHTRRQPSPESKPVSSTSTVAGNHRSQAALLTGIVVLMTCLFGTLDNIITLADAAETVDVASWVRLFLAASGLAAGFLFDVRKRRFMLPLAFCIAMLSTITVLIAESGGSFVVATIIFYLASGFYVVFFTTAFMELAPSMDSPALWAGMGRAANNACAIAIAAPSLLLIQTGNPLLIIGVDLVIFAGIAALLFILFEQGKKDPEEQPLTTEERLAEFAECYGLTPRETEILNTVMESEEPLKNIALGQGISTRMVQRHLSSLYEKTGTQTRAGLTKRFWE